jgi:hypothetical protein
MYCVFCQAQEFEQLPNIIMIETDKSTVHYILSPKPWWLRAATKEWQWVALNPKIYYPTKLDPLKYPAIIEHEKIHLSQQIGKGKFKWLFRYIVSKKFRLDQELEPIAVEISNTSMEQRLLLAERYARNLSGSPYHGAARTYEDALERILSKAIGMGVDVGVATVQKH